MKNKKELEKIINESKEIMAKRSSYMDAPTGLDYIKEKCDEFIANREGNKAVELLKLAKTKYVGYHKSAGFELACIDAVLALAYLKIGDREMAERMYLSKENGKDMRGNFIDYASDSALAELHLKLYPEQFKSLLLEKLEKDPKFRGEVYSKFIRKDRIKSSVVK